MSVNRVMRRPVIGLDLDECLGQFNATILQFYNNLKGTHYTMKDFTSFKYWEVWGGTQEEASTIVIDFFKSPMFLNGIPVVPGSQEAIKILKTKYDIHIVTSRHLDIEETTREWINNYFPGLIDGILIGNFWSGNGRRLTKPEMLQKIHADVFIDDNVGYVTQCKDVVKIPILFGEYGWNRPTQQDNLSGVQQCSNWEEVVNLLMDKTFDYLACLTKQLNHDRGILQACP